MSPPRQKSLKAGWRFHSHKWARVLQQNENQIVKRMGRGMLGLVLYLVSI